MRVYSVTEFRQEMNDLFGQFTLAVQGEVTNFNISRNRFVWFSLKDDKTVIDCFMLTFQLKHNLEDGMEIKVVGSPTMFKKGKFVFRPSRIELVGEGSLKAEYEQLKQQLQKEGLFDEDRKRALPRFPTRIGLVTSGGAAAYTDVLRILDNRWAGLHIVHADVKVQGAGAADSICAAIAQLNEEEPDLDAMIVTRGGGSMEDLQAFNEESVVRAIFASRIPVVSGVGHERDTTLADLAADVRASTPSNAAERIVPDKRDVEGELAYMLERCETQLRNQLREASAEIDSAVYALDQHARTHITRFERLQQQLWFALERFQADAIAKRQSVLGYERLLQSLHPDRVVERGFTMTLDAAGQVVTQAAQLNPGQQITTKFVDGTVESTVVDKPHT